MHCIIDLENKINIPKNENEFFKIEKSETWSFCIEIFFNMREEIIYSNLYLTILSYAKDDFFLATHIGCSFKTKNDKKIITDNINIKKIKNQNYYEFLDWIKFRIEKDWKYDMEESFYSILIFFEKTTCEMRNEKEKIDCLKFLKPIFPWRENILNLLNDNEKLLNKIKNLERKNKILLEVIEKLSK